MPSLTSKCPPPPPPKSVKYPGQGQSLSCGKKHILFREEKQIFRKHLLGQIIENKIIDCQHGFIDRKSCRYGGAPTCNVTPLWLSEG